MWHNAIEEISALLANETWDLVPLSSRKPIVGCQWVFTIKVSLNGTIDHLKAQLVAKGNTQIFGLNYGDTFSLEAKIAFVSVFLAMAAI